MERVNRLSINNNKNINLNIEKKQDNILIKGIKGALNIGLNLGIKAALPNIIEDEVIKLKDSILQNGLKNGLKEGIDNVKNKFKEVMNFFGKNKDNKIKNVEVINDLTKRGGEIDELSKLLSKAIDYTIKSKAINKDLGKAIKAGKSTILRNISNKLRDNMTDVLKEFKNIDELHKNWQAGLNNQDYDVMRKNYMKINKIANEVLPYKELFEKLEEMDLIQKYIEESGNFNLDNNILDLLKKVE